MRGGDRSRNGNGNRKSNKNKELRNQATGEIVFVLLTEKDDRVCPQCRELETETWLPGDPDLPNPPMHPNCRCRLGLAEIGF
jgi:SPP1 gp7 family putative phage head morphogenesis protein